MDNENSIKKRFELLAPFLDERLRRLTASAEAESLGYGGVSLVAKATGVSGRAIRVGKKELRDLGAKEKTLPQHKVPSIRKPGGGRKKTVTKAPRSYKRSQFSS